MQTVITRLTNKDEYPLGIQSSQMYILYAAAGIVILILLNIYDLLIPTLNVQLGLLFVGILMYAAFLLMLEPKKVKRRHDILKKIKNKLFKKKEDIKIQELHKEHLAIIGVTTIVVFYILYWIYDYLIAGLQLSILLFLMYKTIMWVLAEDLSKTPSLSGDLTEENSKVVYLKNFPDPKLLNKRILYLGIGLVGIGLLYGSGLLFIICEFVYHVSVTLLTAVFIIWWINSPEVYEGGKNRDIPEVGAEDSESFNGLEGKRNLEVLIDKIQFKQFYPNGLTLSDVMAVEIRREQLTLHELVLIFIRNLVMLNNECRDRFLNIMMQNLIGQETLFQEDNLWNYIFGNNVSEQNITLNPLDLTTAVFVCSSPTLKQVITEKLFACRFALPFSIPFADTGCLQVHLYPLRSIYLNCIEEGHSFSKNSVDCPCVVASFLRLGRPSISKSILINRLLFDHNYNVFHNKDCPFSETKRYISEGILEAWWYSPSTRSKFLSETTLFLNLRGDGMRWEEQRKLISQISTIVVVLVSFNDFEKPQFQDVIRNLYKSNAGIHLVIDPKNEDRKNVKEKTELYLNSIREYSKTTKISLVPQDKTTRSHLERDIKINLQQLVKAVDKTESLDSRLDKCEVNIDEQHLDLKAAKGIAVAIMDVMNKESANHKENCLPLQAKHLRAWSEKQKKVNKSSLCPTLLDKAKIRQEMIVERQQQAYICKKLGPLMTRFIRSLTDLLPSDTKLQTFVSWLKMYLTERASKIRCKIKKKHTTDVQELQNALNKNVDESVLKLLQHEQYQIDNRCSEEIIGFEHLLREMGQMYEAVIECDEKKGSLQLNEDVLPSLAAKLVILGEPFELLDGEVVNVPLIWIKAVLKKVSEILGDNRVLTVSILGSTGTGKSTLLNTMFGTQFPVNEGIHTKGAFMQLVPAKSHKEKFDFLLVLDTEGLQALDSNQKRKDNEIELTTFVVGLSDAIIVTIGEGKVAEQKNALQIVVQSLLRIKLARKKMNLKQICHLVRQGSRHIEIEMVQERLDIQNALDVWAWEISCQENVPDFKCFKDIIDFDRNRNVWFLPKLLLTDSDTEPQTPIYGECVSTLQESILRDVKETRDSFLTIEDTISRIEDLWNAILKDDFVVSFCSSLEQKAYDNMERQYLLISWRLEKYIMEYSINKAKQRLIICKTRHELEEAVMTIQKYLSDEVDKKESNFLKELESFIEKSSLHDIMSQWKNRIPDRLTKDKAKYVTKAEERIRKIKENVMENQKCFFEKVSKEKRINEMAAELARQLHTENITDTLLEEKFSLFWKKWIKTLESQENTIEVLIKDQIIALLKGKFSSEAAFLGQLSLPSTETYRSYTRLVGTLNVSIISYREHFILLPESDLTPEICRNQTVDVANHIFQKVDHTLAELGFETILFNLTYVHEILDIVVSYISEHNRHLTNTHKFDLLPKFQALLILHVANYTTEFFSKRQKSPCQPQMDDYKETAWCYFKNVARGQTEDVIACGFFNAAVVKVIEEQVSELLPMEAQGSVQGILSHGKQTLIKRILIDLAEKEDFKQYKAFIEDPYTFAEKWILELTNRKMFEEHKDDVSLYAQLAKKQISQILNDLRNIVIKTADDRNAGLSTWIETFVTKNNECNTLPLSKDIFVHVENRNVTNLQTFSHVLTKEIVEMRRRLFGIFEHDTAASVQWITNPVSEILDKLWGCSKLCVFCMEPCMHTSKDHVVEGKLHESVQHRPQGIGGFRHSFTQKMVVDFCSHLVSGEQSYIHTSCEGQYRNYKENFPEWEIPPSSDTSKYWIWVMCKFQNEFAEMYKMRLPDIPEHWTSFTKQTAIDSL